MRHGFTPALASVLFAGVFSCLLSACNGKNGATGPAGEPVTILVTPTPSVAAHSFLGAWGGPAPGTAPGQFSSPLGLWVDGFENIYASDSGNNRIEEIPAVGNDYVTWGSAGATPGEFENPGGITLDASGNLWVADETNNRLQELPAGGGTWVTIGASGAGPGEFENPDYLAFDGAGNLYVSDFLNNRLQELPSGKAATVAANWVTIGNTAGGTGPGQFVQPAGVALDPAGDLWVADQANNRLQELPSGKAATVAANWATIGNTAAGTGPGEFTAVSGVGADPSGDLYAADAGNNRLQELPAGKAATVASNWVTFGSMGSGPGQFDDPSDVKADSQGNVYVADSGNNRIQKLSP